MLYFLIPLILGVITLLPFLYFRSKEQRVIAVIIKGLVSFSFIVTGLVAYLTSKNPQSNFGIFVLVGLFFGLLGDIFLDLKYIVLSKEMFYTILGFFSFAFGHLFFTLGLFLNYYDFNSNILYLIIPIIVTILLTVATLLMEKVSKVRYQKMKPFVLIYGLFLFFTTSIYMSVAIQTHFEVMTITLMAIAFILFMASDLILNNTYFAPGFSGPVFIITNHLLYYIAQFMIAVSLFFII
ncbi:MAG: hypothetical protein IJK27_04630 [Bacilli bacterium]|nr:hypothetical protein [Bacilli bacterium]